MKYFKQLDKCNAKIKTKNNLITESALELVAKFNTGVTYLITENS
ncbi:hypothetical protein RIVM261_049220 [Rivularia sp. IAM M-261]|nr:hypothetical protein RIVM261_049220 [Rivularia sp. IAM M-261]